VMMMTWSCATENHEPCQVRKEAAVSGYFRVPQGSLVGVNCSVPAYGVRSEAGAQLIFFHTSRDISIAACSFFWPFLANIASCFMI